MNAHGCRSCHVCGRCTICGCDHAKDLPSFAETAAHWERLFGVERVPASKAEIDAAAVRAVVDGFKEHGIVGPPSFAEALADLSLDVLAGDRRTGMTQAERDAFRLECDLALLGMNVRDGNGRHVAASDWPRARFRDGVRHFQGWQPSPPLSFIGAAANGERS